QGYQGFLQLVRPEICRTLSLRGPEIAAQVRAAPEAFDRQGGVPHLGRIAQTRQLRGADTTAHLHWPTRQPDIAAQERVDIRRAHNVARRRDEAEFFAYNPARQACSEAAHMGAAAYGLSGQDEGRA